MASEWQGVRCASCGRKGLHYPMHPHAYGWKDYTKLVCRFCGSRFITERVRARVKREQEAAR